MRTVGRPDTYSLTILATSLRKAINNRNTKLMVETKTSPYMHDIELHFTKKKKGHKQEIKKISIEIKKDVVMKKSTTGSQCKPTRNKHRMVTRLTC